MPLEVRRYKNLKSLLNEMEESLEISKDNLERILDLLNEEWSGEGEGSASYPGITVLVDPDKEMVQRQLLRVLVYVVKSLTSLRSSIAIFKTIFSESELESEIEIEAVWDGLRPRVAIVRI